MTAQILEGVRPRAGELQSHDAPAADGPLYTPRIDIHESEQGLTLEADLPGVVPETLDIEVEGNVLRLFGRVAAYVPEQARPVYEEYTTGSFLRSFILSDEMDRERIQATLVDGVLRIQIPKAERTRPQRIEVRTE